MHASFFGYGLHLSDIILFVEMFNVSDLLVCCCMLLESFDAMARC
jgi:hypothetical protein